MNSNVKTAVLWIVLICVAVLIWVVVKAGKTGVEAQPTFTEFMNQVEQGKVKGVQISGNQVKGQYTDGSRLVTMIPMNYPDLYKTLRDKNVNMDIREASSGNWVSILINAIPFVLLLAFWIFFMRQMQSGGNKALSFGKSRARLHHPSRRRSHSKTLPALKRPKKNCRRSSNSSRSLRNSRNWADDSQGRAPGRPSGHR